MRLRGSTLAIVIAGVVSASAVSAADIQRGKSLHQANCLACHGTEVYTRDDRRIQSLLQLQRQVQRCTRAAGVEWDAQAVEDVVGYLNQRFYGFEE